MTNEEAIKHLEFMAKGYQNLLDNDERCLEAVGKGYKGEVEAQESLADVYKMQIEVLNLAIKAIKKEPKTGHWIIDDKEGNKIWHCHCSECNKDPQDYIGGTENWWLVRLPNNCPNCGAKMERIEDE